MQTCCSVETHSFVDTWTILPSLFVHSVALVDGENVDWPGWCFDDDEVMYHLGGNGLLEDINRSLNHLYIQQLSEPEEGECSQV